MVYQLADDGRFLYEKRGGLQSYEEGAFEELDSFSKFLSSRKVRAVVLPIMSFEFLELLLKEYDDLSRIILLFPDQSLVDEWLSMNPFKGEIVPILLDDDLMWGKALEACQVALCEASILSYFPERFRRYDRSVQKEVELKLLKSLQFSASQVAHKTFRSWHEALNTLSNLQDLRTNRVLESALDGKFVIVGAGPSLDGTVKTLKRLQGRAWIVACDAAVRTLLNAGVKPDFIVTLESLYSSSRFFVGIEDQLSSIPLVHYTASNPKLLSSYLGPLLAVKSLSKDHYFKDYYTGIPYLYAGACVGHVAFSFAEFCGAKEIVMTGFDLAYKGNEFHCSAMSTKYYEDGDCANPTMVPAALGGELRTDASMKNFLEIFEKQIELSSAKVIDATEGGALKRGAIISSLDKALANGVELKKVYSFKEQALRVFELEPFVASLFKYEGQLNLFIEDYLNRHPKAGFLAEFCSFKQMILLKDLGRDAVDLNLLNEELSEALSLLKMYARCRSEDEVMKGRYVLFVDGEMAVEKVRASFPDFDFIEDSCEGDLCKAWKAVLENQAEGLVFVDSLLPPEAWMIPQRKAIEYKVSNDYKHYEFCAWSQNYSILADENSFSFWREKLPNELDVRLIN